MQTTRTLSGHGTRLSPGRSRVHIPTHPRIRTSSSNNTQVPTAPPSSPPPPTPPVLKNVPSVIGQSLMSLSSFDDEDKRNFRFLPNQLEVFKGLVFSMKNCSRALATLAFGSVVTNAFEAVEHAHHAAHHAAEHVAAAGAAAGEAVAAVATEAAGHAAAVADAATQTGSMQFIAEVLRAVSPNDVAFCVNEIIPAVLIMWAVEPFARLAEDPDEPQMALALKGVGRLSVTMQQLAWTSGSVGVVLLLVAATEYPPIVGIASGLCMLLAGARGTALWWVVTRHTTSGEEVARTLAALRGSTNAAPMNPLDRAASWLALGALLQAEPGIHEADAPGHSHHHSHHHSHSHAAADGALVKPHYSFGSREERVLRSLVEATTAAGLATSLQVLATLALALAEALSDNSGGWVSNVILATQKSANAFVMFASAAAFDQALHNDDGNDDTDHLLEGLGREHSGMAGLFGSMAVLSLALLMAGTVALMVPALEDSPLGVLVGDGVMHASADLLVEVLEAL